LPANISSQPSINQPDLAHHWSFKKANFQERKTGQATTTQKRKKKREKKKQPREATGTDHQMAHGARDHVTNAGPTAHSIHQSRHSSTESSNGHAGRAKMAGTSLKVPQISQVCTSASFLDEAS
jgi:hypothetical protein